MARDACRKCRRGAAAAALQLVRSKSSLEVEDNMVMVDGFLLRLLCLFSPSNDESDRCDVSTEQARLLAILSVLVAIFSIYFAQIRIDSETHLRKALAAKDRGNHQEL